MGQYVVLKRIPQGGGNSVAPGEVVDAGEWRNIRSLIANGYVTPVADTQEDVLAEARNIRRGGPLAQRSLQKLGEKGRQLTQEEAPAQEPEPEVEEEVLEDEVVADEFDSEEDPLEQYHTGHGWYELPGQDSKVRREEALMLLSESPPGDDEA